jgi:hypothetical protein
LLWFIICPLAFWLDDTLRHFLYKEGSLYNIWSVYKDLFCVLKKTNYQSTT